jgi:chemosensory pili system protein ChpA (sensor histidine kinase/response regulator)
MQIDEAAGVISPIAGVTDLGPLAWVLDELRKSLDVANKSLKRFVRDTEAARGTDSGSVDASQLRMARQQMHQAVGALEMVGLTAPAHMLRAMESAVQRFLERPEKCNEASAVVLERASFALLEYLDVTMAGAQHSAVGLFPQYRDAQLLAGSDRIHPADLWSLEWRWIRPERTAFEHRSTTAEMGDRASMDHAVLRVMQKGDRKAAAELRDLSLAVAEADPQGHSEIFWLICAAYFEAIASDLLPVDLYVKRVASQVLMHFASFVRGERHVSERLARDMLFFCAQSLPVASQDTPCLAAIRKAYGLNRFAPVDYEVRGYGRYDPAVITQARKRIDAVKEAWSALAGGDVNRLKNVVDQFSLVADSILKLHPRGERLAEGLKRAAEQTARSGKPPGAEVALEVATSVLYLEVALADREQDDGELSMRTNRLAERLEKVCAGGTAEPLEHWMEDLYRRVSDRQTMGTVVGELRVTLSEAEKALDQFFRDPSSKSHLNAVPGLLSQMRGVLSVIGLDQASQAVMRMRENVEAMLVTDVDVELVRSSGTFDTLGNNLGALSFLIDMLNYQPALAKKLFVFDAALGELRPVMGRSATASESGPSDGEPGEATALQPDRDEPLDALVSASTGAADGLMPGTDWALDFDLPDAIPDEVRALDREEAGTLPELAQVAGGGASLHPSTQVSESQIEVTEFDEGDLQDIFLEEANEVIQNGLAALDALALDAHDLTQQTILRRAFHTLKGSSRMVGLMEFGEAAWSLEQLLNAWLSEQKPANAELCSLSREALGAFQRWVDDIARGHAGHWKAGIFQNAADALRKDNTRLALILPEPLAESPETQASTPGSVEPVESESEAGSTQIMEMEPFVEESAMADEALLEAFDFSSPVDQPPEAGVETRALAEPVEIAAIDLDSLAAVSDQPPLADEVSVEQDAAREAIEAPSMADVGLETFADDAVEEDQIKVIGSLRIGIPLYNVFLNEADEWSRRMTIQLTEWSMELHQPVPAEAEALAHSLAGSSATVGFLSLSEMARALEHALQRLHDQQVGTAVQGRVFREAAEDIRRLLHQFAAGFLKDPNPTLLAELKSIEVNDEVVVSDDEEATTDVEQPQGKPAAVGDEAAVAVEDEVAPAVEDVAAPAGEAAEWLAQPTLDDAGPAVEQSLSGLAAEPILGSPEVPSPLPVEAVAAPHLAPEPEPEPEPEAAHQSALAEPLITPRVTPLTALPVAERFAQRALAGQDVESDDIDLVDVLDPDLFPIFEDEASELLPQLGGALRQWGARPDNTTARGEVLRALHTLKGSSRLAGALQLGEMAHRMESEIESIGSGPVQSAEIAPLLARLDALEGKFEALRKINLQAPVPETSEPPVSASDLDEPVPVPESWDTAPEPGARGPVAQPSPMLVAQVRAAANQAVRVRSQLLDRLVNQAGEVMITRSRLEAEMGQLRGSLQDLSGNLDRLRNQLRDIELQAESQMQSRMAQAKDSQQNFDPLEFDRFTRVQELTRMMAESVNDVATVQRNLQRTVEATEDDLVAQARQTRALQQDLLRTRMMEFEGISERLYRVVRQASKDTGKQVKLDITGGSIEMDRGVLDRMTAAFEHLLRNCVVHGIEDPAARVAAQKEPTGTITIDLQQAGNDVSVTFRDDGAGLDLRRILEKARHHGLVSTDQALTDDEAANLIFMPGFTTAAEVTELAGRGIGMDVVRSEVQALGGRIETETQAGLGTSFKLVLPLTTAVTQVVVMRSGTISLGVPANLVELVRRVTARELEKAYATGVLEFAGESLPFFWSGALLQSSPHSIEPVAKTMPVVVFRSASQRVAVHLDEILGNQEAVVKNLGPQLSRLPGLAGMTVLASGAVILIYNPVALATVYGDQARQFSAAQADVETLEAPTGVAGTPARVAPAAVPQVPLILVVDDSITVRRVTQRLLQREGYRVALAADGLQALERLQEERPVVVLSDIEMPRMDGFDLARNIRADARLTDLPIVMITSRIAEKHREHAQSLGVNHYLGKPYSEEELLSLVRHYVEAPATA